MAAEPVPAATIMLLREAAALAFFVVSIRETFEEAGVLRDRR